MMTSAQIRQSFLDFFKSKQHTIVPSSSLMPDSPNLLFTNAGMNQFVPIFLGQVKCPYTPGRAADTQKCIRAGGKHNDLDDVGLDTYHHTFFEMLGNWSFGDYFKREAIEWAWELVINIWKFPPQRLYATVYNPDKSKNDPSEFDQEAWNFWAEKFRSVGLDPAVHIVNGNKKDNFWMMGDTGPCGPCSELHVDLTPDGDTRGALVNKGDARCIEIWNLVFIQFNAQPATGSARVSRAVSGVPPESSLNKESDGGVVGGTPTTAPETGALPIEYVPLAAKHVDTGMGFERVTSIIQGTRGFTDFQNAKISNYETDIFRPIFDALEKMSGKTYRSTLPGGSSGHAPAQPLSPDAPLKTVGEAPGGIIEVGSGECLPSDGQKEPIRPLGAGFPSKNEDLGALGGAHQPVVGPHQSLVGTPQPLGAVPEPVGATPQSFGSGPQSLRTVPRPSGDGPERLGATPQPSGHPSSEQEAIDIAFRVIADHIRTLSFAIADGIQPGNTDRNYVLRRILRRAVRYGRTLGFHEPFFYKLVDVLAQTMGDVFPEIRARQQHVKDVLKLEEESFNKTLDSGLQIFDQLIALHAKVSALPGKISGPLKTLAGYLSSPDPKTIDFNTYGKEVVTIANSTTGVLLPLLEKVGSTHEMTVVRNAQRMPREVETFYDYGDFSGWEERRLLFLDLVFQTTSNANQISRKENDFWGSSAFLLYDTYGFPLDLTELMARERGLTVDTAGFEKLMDEQRARARAAQKKEVIELSQIETTTPTKFVGFDTLSTKAKVLEVVGVKDKTAVVLDTSSAYAEMGGQVGDTGELSGSGQLWRVVNTQKSGNTWLHFIASQISNQGSQIADVPAVGSEVEFTVDRARRDAIQRHHTVTHLLHWALHEVVSNEASQKGSFVGPDKLTFDFNAQPLTPQQVADIEKLVNERVLENAGVSWTEVPYADVNSRKDVMQFFGDKYGDTVRVVQVGGRAGELNGYSMELCGGTHTRATGEIGLFRIVGENAIAAGVRRIEAVAGLPAYDVANQQLQLIKSIAGKINSPVHELEKKVEALLAHQKELEKQLKAAAQREAAGKAKDLVAKAKTINGTPALIENVGTADGDTVQSIVDAVKANFKGVIVLGAANNGAVSLVASVSPEFTGKVQAGKIIQTIAPIVGGKGGGKPDNARGGGKDASKLDEALSKAASLLG